MQDGAGDALVAAHAAKKKGSAGAALLSNRPTPSREAGNRTWTSYSDFGAFVASFSRIRADLPERSRR